MKNMILIVEEYDSIREILFYSLNDEGYKTYGDSNGIDG